MVVEDSTIWGNGNAVKEPKGNHLKCSNNRNDDFTFIMNTAFVQQNEGVDVSENIEVNVTELTNLDRIRYGLVEARSQDMTESSSSFEESISEVDESDLCGDVTSAVAFGEVSDILSMRRKKVTSQWRAFVKPIMWRCKWVELQVRKLKSLARKYDKELAQYSDKKQFEFKNFGSEDINSKSVPFPFTPQRNKVLERKRRRRNEDKLDIAEYMSKHNLFSFYENRKSAADGAFWTDDQFNSVISTEKLKSSNELKLDEELVHLMHMHRNNSMEQILRKIGGFQSQVSRLKARVKKVMSENAGKFTCADNPGLHVPSNAFTNLKQLTGLPTDTEDRMIEGSPSIATQLLAKYSMDDVVVPYSEVWKNGERITERTDQSLVVGTRVNNEDVFMIYDYRMKERMRSFQEVEIQPEEKLQIIEGGQRSAIPPVRMELNLPLDDQSAQGLLSITNNKSRKGRGHSISSGWSKRSSA